MQYQVPGEEDVTQEYDMPLSDLSFPLDGKNKPVTLHCKYPKYNKIASDVHDSNEVVPGDDYELFYWNDEWCSLGRKIAVHDTLAYVEVPKNSLLWLHNHTQGKEERIFTYENGRQIWW